MLMQPVPIVSSDSCAGDADLQTKYDMARSTLYMYQLGLSGAHPAYVSFIIDDSISKPQVVTDG
jgi:hypothetical protein